MLLKDHINNKLNKLNKRITRINKFVEKNHLTKRQQDKAFNLISELNHSLGVNATLALWTFTEENRSL